jgi:hypothetical protein
MYVLVDICRNVFSCRPVSVAVRTINLFNYIENIAVRALGLVHLPAFLRDCLHQTDR